MISLTAEQQERARRLHDDAVVVDALASGPKPFSDESWAVMKEMAARGESLWAINDAGRAIGDRELLAGGLPAYRDSWAASGVDVASCTIGFHGPRLQTHDNAVRDIGRWTRLFDASDLLVKVTRAADIEHAHETGKRGIIFNFQNTSYFDDDLDALALFHDLGVRQIQLTYNGRNLVGDGCTERDARGLSYFGIKVVKALNELGILIDVSHCSARTSIEAAEHSDKPIAITHSAAAELFPHDRNKTDDVIRAVGERDGFVGIYPVVWLTHDKPTLEHWLRHIDHVANLVGIDHVGIGTDLDDAPLRGLLAAETTSDLFRQRLQRDVAFLGMRPEHSVEFAAIEGFATWDDWPQLTAALVHAGYSDDEIRGVLGGNFLRVFREAIG
jgi:membrane dipeptidase